MPATGELIRRAASACERRDCRIMERGAQSGLVGYVPTYDRNGNLLNEPVGVVWRFSCLTCGASLAVQGSVASDFCGGTYARQPLIAALGVANAR